MDTNNLQLSEEHKLKLDAVVGRMVANKESDENIQWVVNDYKSLYGKPAQKATLGQKILKGAETVVDLVGAKGITEAYGAEIARGQAKTPEEKSIIEQTAYPSGKEVVGSALQTGSLFIPIGTIAGGISKGLRGLRLGTKSAKIAGNVIAGGAAGGTYDVGEKLQTGETSGLATAVGTAIPLAGPVVKGASKLAGKVGGEFLGKTTGAQFGALKEGLEATIEGGERAKAFKGALRGETNPEQLVEEAKNGLSEVYKQRTAQYQQDLATIKTKTNVIDHKPVIENFNKKLEDFGVFQNADGVADFSRAPGLGRYETDLKKMSQTLANWGSRPGDNTIAGMDKLKQVIRDFRIGTRKSARFDTFVDSLSEEAQDSIRKTLKNSGDTQALNTYNRMMGNYEEKTGLIKELSKGLSLGDKPSVDTAFRKLTSALRQNNEFRRELVKELDDVTGGLLTSKIAGQQLNPVLPRGLSGPLSAIGGTGALMTGVGLAKLLPAVIAFSPRAVGELVSALGFTGRMAGELKGILKKLFGTPQFPGDAALKGVQADLKTIKETPNKQGGFARNPFAVVDIPKSIRPESVASKMDNTDFYLIEKYVREGESAKTAEVKTILKEMGISKADVDIQDRFLKDVLDEYRRKETKIKPTPIRSEDGRFNGSEAAIPKDLATEARKYKSAEEFVKAFNKRSFNPFGVDDTKIPKSDIELHNSFMEYAQKPEIQTIYEQGGNDTKVLIDIWKKANGKK